MKKFKLFTVLTKPIRKRAAEKESAFEPTIHVVPRVESVESMHTFKWKQARIRT